METEAKVPEDASATSFTLVESITKIDSEELKFPQKSGNDLNSKYPLVEETRQPNSGITSEISVTGPQEIYQESSKASAVHEKQAEHQPEGHSIEKILKHSNAEGLVVMEVIPKSGELEDKAMSILLTTASGQVETVEDSIQDEIQKEAKSEVTDNNEQQEAEKYFEEKEEVPEAFDLHKVTGKICMENEKKAQPQSEAQSLDTKVIKNPNLEGETTEINPSNDTEELEKVSASCTGEKLNIKDGGEFIKEEAKEMEEATNTQLQKTATESVPVNGAPSTLPTSAIAKGETVDEIFEKQRLKEEESATIENESCRTESELEQAAKAIEAIDLPETTGRFNGENEEHDDHHSEAATLESTITKHTISEGLMTIQSVTKSSYDIEEPEKIPDSHTAENSESKDGGKTLLEETIYIKEAMGMELQKSETKSVPQDKALSTLLATASFTAETVEESTQDEIHKEALSAVTDTEEELRPEYDFEEKKNKAFDVHKVIAGTEKEYESQSEAPNPETIVIKHQNLEGDPTEPNPSNETELLEMVPASHNEEKLEIKEDGKFIPEKAKEMRQATDMQLTKSATESVPDNEAQSTLTKSTTVKGEKVDEIFQEQTLKEEESATVHNSESCIPENELTQTATFLEAIGLPETMGKVAAENEEHADNQSESLALESIITKHTLSEGLVTMESSTKSSYDVEELHEIPESHFVENSEIKDDGKTALEEAIYIKEATDVELPNSDTEGVRADKSLSPLPTTEAVGVGTFEESFEEEIYTKAESAVTDTKEGQRPENDFEEAINPDAAIGNTLAETRKRDQPHSQETTVISHPNLEGETTETNINNDTEEIEKITVSHTGQKLEIKYGGTFIEEKTKEMEEAKVMQLLKTATESVPEDKTLSTLPSTASVGVGRVEESIQEEIHKEGESAVTDINDIKEGLRPENDFDEKKKFLEAFEVHEATAENEKKDESQLEVQSLETMDIRHPNLDGETTEKSPSNDTEELEKVLASCNNEKLEIKEGGKYTQEDAKVMEEATDMQLLKTATDGFDDEAPSILPTLSIVKGEAVEETLHLQTLKDEEPVATDNDGSCKPGNDLEQTATVVEDIDAHETVGKVGAENEQHAEDESKAPKLENTITKHTNSEGMVTTEGSTKTSNEVEEQEKTPESYAVENSKIKDSSKTQPEHTIPIKEATSVESPKSETESAREDKALSTLPTAASAGVEKLEESIQEEIHKEVESAVTNTEEVQTQENDFEAFELHEAPGNICVETKKKEEPQSGAQSLQTIVIEHPDLDRDTIDTNRCNDTEEGECVPGSHTSEKFEIKDRGKFILEEAKEMEKAIDMQLQQSAKESVPYDEAPSTLPTSAMGKDETVEKILQKQTFLKEEPATTGKDGSSGPEDEFKETAKFVEAIDLPKTNGKVGAETEQEADHQSKVPELETLTTKHTNSEGIVTMQGSTKASYDVEQEKTFESHSVDNSDSKDSVKTLPEQAIYIKEATYVESPKSETESLPEDKAMSTLPTTASAGVEKVEESIHEEIHKEAESAVAESKVGQRSENDFEEEKKVPEDFDLHKTIGNTCVETEKKDETQYEVQSLETIVMEHPDLEGDTTEIDTGNDTEETEQVQASHTSEKLEIKDRGEFILEETKEMEEAIDIQLEESAKESVPDDEAPSILPTSAIVKGEMVDENFQEQTFNKEDSAVVDTDRNFRQENELDETAKAVEATDIPKTTGKVSEESEQHTDHQYEFPTLETPITGRTNSEGIGTMEGSTKTSYDVDGQGKIPESHSVENSEVKDGGKALPEEAIYFKETTYVELPKSETKTVPEDKALSILPTTASLRVETVEESNQEERQKEAESPVTDTKEGQRPENDFGEKKNVPEAFDLHEATGNTCVRTENQDEPQCEAQRQKAIVVEHPDLEQDATKTNPRNNTEEFVQVPASHTREKLEINSGEKFIPDESKEMDESTGTPEDEAPLTLPTAAIVRGETDEEIFQEQALNEEESTAKDIDGSCRTENELEQTAKVYEAIDVPKTMSKVDAENGENADHKTETPTLENAITMHTISEGSVTMQISTESRYDIEELEKIPESHSVVNSEIKDSEETLLEEATAVDLPKSETETVSEDKAMSTSPTTAFVGVATIEESIQEEINKEAESTVKDTEVGQRPEHDLEDKKNVHEALDLHKTTVENQCQLEAQNEGTIVINHPNLERETTETNPGNDTEELKQLPVSITKEKSEIKDEWRFIQEEAKLMEEATDMQLHDSAKESAPDNEAPPTLPTLAIVKARTVKEIIQKQTFKEEESAIIDYDRSCRSENEPDQRTKDVEAIDLPETLGKVGAQHKEHADHQFEAFTLETMTKHTNLDGLETTEISTESKYDVEKLEKIPESHPADNSQIKDGEQTAPEEATYINKATDVEFLKSETESVPEDKTLSTLPTTSSVEVETIEESIQEEIHKQVESVVTEIKEGRRPEIDVEERKKFSEDFHLHEATLENKKIDELQFEGQSQETIVIENPYLEGDTAKTNPSNDNEELEQVSASHTEEELKIKDGGKIIQEEAKVIEETNDMRLLESAKESIPDDKALSTLPTSAIIKGERVEEIVQEQTLKEEKSAAIDNDGSCRPENELEQAPKIVEAIDLPETMDKVGDQNKEHADHQSDACTLETAIKKHTISEGLETTEINTESSNDVEELENIPKSCNVENSEIKDGGKTMAEETAYIKEATDVESPKSETKSEPEDKALSTLPTIASVGIETIEESIQEEEIDKEGESAMTNTEEGQRRENDFDEKKNVHEVHLQEAAFENEKMDERQSEVQSLETMVIEHADLDGGTTKTNKSKDTEELDQVQESHTEEKLEIKDGAKFIQEEAIEMEKAIYVHLPESEKESIPPDKAPSTLPTSSIVKGKTVEEFFQGQTPKIKKSAAIDNDGRRRPENEFEQTAKVVEAIDLPETMGKAGAENEEHADHQFEALTSETAATKHTTAEGLEAMEISNRKELEKNPESPTTVSVRVEAIDQSIQEKIHEEAESAVTYTEERQRPENDFKEKKTIVEDFDLHEATAESERKDEPQSEAQSTETMVIKHPNIEGTTETNPSNDIEELEQVPVSRTKEKLEIKDGGKFIQEEANEMEEAIDMQLPEIAEESVPDDEALSTLAKSEIVKCEKVDEIFQEQTFTEEKLATIDNLWNSRPENVLEQTVKVVEVNLPETMGNVGEENDKHSNRQSEAPTMETVVTKHTISEGLETMEIHTKSSYYAEELEMILESHSVENSKIKDGGKTMPEKAIYINEATDMESAKSKTESVSDDNSLSNLPTTASVGVETMEESIQEEIHKEAETAGTDTDESQRMESAVPEALHLHKATAENEKKDEPQSDAQSLETIVIKPANSEDTTETIPSNDSEKLIQVPVSYTAEKSEIKDAGKFILEEAKEMEEAIDMQLQESAKENNEAPSTLPTSAIVKVETLQESFQEQKLEEEKSAAIDNDRSCRPENELEQTAKVVEANELPKTMVKVGAESEEYADHQSEAPTTETMFTRHTISEGLVIMASSTESSNDVEEPEKIPESRNVENSEIKDGQKTMADKAIYIKEATDVESPKYETKSKPDDNALSTLPSIASVRIETIEDRIQEEIHKEAESAVTNTEEGQRREKDFDEQKNVHEEAAFENENMDEHQSEVQSLETVIEHAELDGGTAKTKKNNDTEELELVQALHIEEKLEIKDRAKFIQGVPEESIQEKIHKEAKSAIINTKEGQRPENDLEEKKDSEAFDQHEATSNTSAENEKKDEPQPEGQSVETTVMKLDGETTETNPTNDTDELEQVPASQTREKIEIKDGGKFTQEEEKKMDEATDTSLPISAKRSVPDKETLATLSTSAIVKGESEMVEEIFPEATFKEEELAAIDDKGSSRPENKIEQTAKVVQAIDPPETMSKFSGENEEYTDHQSEAPTLEIVITKHTNSEGMVTIESSTKSSYDVKQQEKFLEAHSVDSSKDKDGGKATPEEAIYIREATDVELAKSETKSMPENNPLSTLLATAAGRVEIVDESTQIAIQKEAESAATETDEGNRPENDFEGEIQVPEAFDLHGVTVNNCAKNKRKDEPQSEAQSLETIVIKHPNIEGETTETNPSNDTEEVERVPASGTREKLEIKDGGKFIQEEAKETEEATGVPNDEAPSTLPISAIAKGETVDEIFEDQTLKEEESIAIDNEKSCKPENELEQTAKVVEAIDLIETMDKVSAENEEHADFQSEAPILENVISKHTISGGMVTTESSTKSSYDGEKLEKLPESHTAENSEIKDGVKFPPEEAIYIKEATSVKLHTPETESVPEDKALSTTNTASVGVRTVEQSIQEEIHKEPESAVTDNKEEQRSENNFEEEKKVPEALYLHKEIGNTCAKNEKNAEPQSEAQSVETMLIKLPNYEGLETKNISPSNNSAELEKLPASYTGEKLEMEEEETDTQLPKSEIEIAAKSELDDQSDMRESPTMRKSELPLDKFYSSIIVDKIPYKKVESCPDYEACDLIKEQLPQTKERSNNIQDQISEPDDHIQRQKFQFENQIKPEPQLEAEHQFNIPLNAKQTSAASLITKEVHDGGDKAGGSENIEEQTIDSENSLAEARISIPQEDTVNQVKDDIPKISKATDSNEHKVIASLSVENDPAEKEAAYRDSADVIEPEATEKHETQEAEETPQIGRAKEDEGGDKFEKISPPSSGSAMIKGFRETDVKAPSHKKSHGIISTVKHSISKVKKAITGKSSHPKKPSPKPKISE